MTKFKHAPNAALIGNRWEGEVLIKGARKYKQGNWELRISDYKKAIAECLIRQR